MFTLDRTRAKDILVTELGYEPIAAEIYLRDYPQLHDQFAAAMERWLSDRSVTDAEFVGLKIDEVMRARGDHFLEVVRLLNRLLDDDVPDDQRKHLAESLRRPAIRW